MHQLINKKKIYFYIFSFFFLTTILNNNFITNFNDSFSINEIKIISNSESINKKISLEIKHLKNKNIFFLKEDVFYSKLKKLNYLENIKVKKKYPSTIIIDFSNTNLVAVTFINQKKYFVGENGKFINANLFKEKEKLPIIFGNFEIKEYLSLKSKLSKYDIDQKKIKKYYFHKNKRWDLYFNNNIILKLPQKNINYALKIYKEFKNLNELRANSIVDLRIPNRIILNNE